ADLFEHRAQVVGDQHLVLDDKGLHVRPPFALNRTVWVNPTPLACCTVPPSWRVIIRTSVRPTVAVCSGTALPDHPAPSSETVSSYQPSASAGRRSIRTLPCLPSEKACLRALESSSLRMSPRGIA